MNKTNKGKQAEETDKGITTLGAQNDEIVGSSKGKREVLSGHHRKLGTSTNNERFDAGFEVEISAWAEAM